MLELKGIAGIVLRSEDAASSRERSKGRGGVAEPVVNGLTNGIACGPTNRAPSALKFKSSWPLFVQGFGHALLLPAGEGFDIRRTVRHDFTSLV